MNTEEKKKILKTRAMALAGELQKEEKAGDYIEIIEFMLAYERYGIETRYMRECYPLKDLTTLPCTPEFVLGVINVRGRIISVINLKKFFGLPQRELTDLNKVVIVHNNTMEFGILADVILGARLVLVRDLQPSLPTLTDIRAEYLRGVTMDRLVVLDAGKILSDKKIIVHEEV